MNSLLLLLPLLFGVCLVAWWCTGRFLRYALAERLLDVPTARSSHTVVTPRGGGAAIVLSVLLALLVLGVLGTVEWPLIWGIAGGGALAALIGFVDDHRHVPPHWRLFGHLVAASWVVAWLGGLPPLALFHSLLDLGWWGKGLAALYLVYVLNLTNFMDGIDGIASVETISVCLAGALLGLLAVPGSTQWILPATLASATLGFLFWNWPPAKIFMGDVGSGFLGLMLAALSLHMASMAPQLLWAWAILLGVFMVDATVTLVRRVARRERFYEAHRSHAYQHAAQRWGHRGVTLAVAAINAGWLLPVAFLVTVGRLDGLAGVGMAYAPLVALALWLNAGSSSST